MFVSPPLTEMCCFRKTDSVSRRYVKLRWYKRIAGRSAAANRRRLSRLPVLWEFHPECSLTAVALHADLSLVEFHDSFHNGQSDTCAFRSVGSIGLIKFIENTFPVLFFDLRAIIFDGNGDRSVFLTLFVSMLPDENRYLSFLRRKFYGVVQKIYPYLLSFRRAEQ